VAINFRNLELSPYENPLVKPTTIRLKNRVARTASKERSLLDPETGEISAVAAIHTVDVKDDEQFVKVFSEGVKAAFNLNRTAARVFQAVLQAYQAEKMTGGYSDCVRLEWFDDGLNGEKIGMTDRTFYNGLRSLLENKFLWPRSPSLYWVNPALFFKGDRVAFIREFRRKTTLEQQVIDGDTISQSLPLE
jgi:hypothetical protein